MFSSCADKLQAIDRRKAALRAELDGLTAEESKARRALVFDVLAEAEELQTPKELADKLSGRGVFLEPGDLLTLLDTGVRQNRLRRSGPRYELIRPGVSFR